MLSCSAVLFRCQSGLCYRVCCRHMSVFKIMSHSQLWADAHVIFSKECLCHGLRATLQDEGLIDCHTGSVWLTHWRHKVPHIPVERYCVNKSIRRVASELSSFLSWAFSDFFAISGCIPHINPFAAVLMSYLVMHCLVAVCPCPSAEYTRHTAHSSNAWRGT